MLKFCLSKFKFRELLCVSELPRCVESPALRCILWIIDNELIAKQGLCLRGCEPRECRWDLAWLQEEQRAIGVGEEIGLSGDGNGTEVFIVLMGYGLTCGEESTRAGLVEKCFGGGIRCWSARRWMIRINEDALEPCGNRVVEIEISFETEFSLDECCAR